jgi:PLP dependent protein
MAVDEIAYRRISTELAAAGVTLVAVSKTKPTEDIEALRMLGQMDFGENYVQELTEKREQLPQELRWHFIGHLQSNKIKYIAPFVHLIHGVDSFRLLQEINKQATKISRLIRCLLQVHIAQEEAKFGFSEEELLQALENPRWTELTNIQVGGLMGMASFSQDMDKVRREFKQLRSLFEQCKAVRLPNCQWDTLSMGMSADYQIAVEEGSTMVRIGSLLFGKRD